MRDLNYLAVTVSAVAAFFLSSAWYIVFAGLTDEASSGRDDGRPEPWQILVELARSAVVASLLAGLTLQLGITTWTGSGLLALSLWVGFPVVLLTGSVIWEDVPVKTAALHAGDWLFKLVLIAVIVGVWQAA